jgi:hypothetical protein
MFNKCYTDLKNKEKAGSLGKHINSCLEFIV